MPKTMTISEIKIEITGISGLILHNGRLADESDVLTVARKEAQARYKKNPTKATWEEFAKAMMTGGVYWAQDLGVYIPEDNLRSMLVKAGAGIKKKGLQTFKGAASTLNFENYGFSVLDGGKRLTDLDEFVSSPRYRFERVVTIQKNKVRSVRPIVPKGWTCEVTVSFMPSVIEDDTIVELFQVSGLEIGIGDWRPSAPKPGPFGRFIVSKINGKEVA